MQDRTRSLACFQGKCNDERTSVCLDGHTGCAIQESYKNETLVVFKNSTCPKYQKMRTIQNLEAPPCLPNKVPWDHFLSRQMGSNLQDKPKGPETGVVFSCPFNVIVCLHCMGRSVFQWFSLEHGMTTVCLQDTCTLKFTKNQCFTTPTAELEHEMRNCFYLIPTIVVFSFYPFCYCCVCCQLVAICKHEQRANWLQKRNGFERSNTYKTS